MRGGPLLLATLLLAPLAAGWSQEGGDAARSGLAPTPAGILDVVATYRIINSTSETLGSGARLPLVETPFGLVGAIQGNASGALAITIPCAWVRVTDPMAGTFERLQEGSCEDARRLFGYDATRDLLLVDLGNGSLGAIRGRDLSLVWSVAPPVGDAPVGAPSAGWSVAAVAVEEDRVVVLWRASRDGSGNDAGAFDLETGTTLWRRAFSSAGMGIFSFRELDAAYSRELASFLPWGIAATSTGYLVTGTDASLPSAVSAVWITREGEYRGGESAAQRQALALEPQTGVFATSQRPAANGTRAAALLGAEILVVDPASLVVSRFLRGTRNLDASEAEPIWVGSRFLAPSSTGVAAHEASDMRPLWEWGGLPGAAFADMVSDGSRLYVLLRFSDGTSTGVTLTELDLRDGRVMRSVPVLRTPFFRDLPVIVPLSADGYLVVTPSGNVSVLGAADPARLPAIDVTTDHPPASEPLTLQLGTDPNIEAFSIAWGDGAFETGTPGESATHAYAEPVRASLRLTAIFADGTTATSERTIFVGEPDLTPIQDAFSPANQNLTFFLIGLAVTGGGALFAAILRQRRHSRLAQEEHLLRKVVDEALLRPTQGLAALETHRAHLRDQHTRRRIDDAQFALLDSRTVRAMKSARYRLLGASLNKLTPHFRRVLDTALEDGQVTQGEMGALIATLDEERALSEEERERVRSLLAAWAR